MGKEFVVACPQCGKKLKSSKRFIGRMARCPGCGYSIRVGEKQGGAEAAAEESLVPDADAAARQATLLVVTKQGDVGVVSFTTSRILDQSNVQQLGDEFDKLVEGSKFNKFVINFESINYMSSTVMGKLVGLLKKVKAAHGSLALCNIGDSIYEIFKIMRFDELFDIFNTEDQAVVAMMKVT